MLFEEWQKWLDSQFLDAQNEADIQDNTKYEKVELSDSPISSISDISLPTQNVSSPTENPIPVQHIATPFPVSDSPREDKTIGNTPEAVDVPTIDKYLPHFRKSQSVDMPAEPINTLETTHASDESPPIETSNDPSYSEENDAIVVEIHPEAIVDEVTAQSSETEANEPEPIPAETSPLQEMTIKVSTSSTETDCNAIYSVETQPETNWESDKPNISEKQTLKEAVTDPSEIPAPRVARKVRSSRQNSDEDASKNVNLWDMVPRRMEVLISMNPVMSTTTQYNRELKEQRIQSLKVLTDPDISYVDASRILNAPVQIARSPKKTNHLILLKSSRGLEGPKMADIMSFLEAQSKKVNTNTH